jgi:hypothetical protein
MLELMTKQKLIQYSILGRPHSGEQRQGVLCLSWISSQILESPNCFVSGRSGKYYFLARKPQKKLGQQKTETETFPFSESLLIFIFVSFPVQIVLRLASPLGHKHHHHHRLCFCLGILWWLDFVSVCVCLCAFVDSMPDFAEQTSTGLCKHGLL